MVGAVGSWNEACRPWGRCSCGAVLGNAPPLLIAKQDQPTGPLFPKSQNLEELCYKHQLSVVTACVGWRGKQSGGGGQAINVDEVHTNRPAMQAASVGELRDGRTDGRTGFYNWEMRSEHVQYHLPCFAVTYFVQCGVPFFCYVPFSYATKYTFSYVLSIFCYVVPFRGLPFSNDIPSRHGVPFRYVVPIRCDVFLRYRVRFRV